MSEKSTMNSENRRPKNMNVIRRSNYDEHHDDFPTPPWATRAFFEHVAPELTLNSRHLTVLEPACGRGHMVGVLKKLKFRVMAYDQLDYLKGFPEADYVDPSSKFPPYDVMFTNPPYKLAGAFVERALDEARVGVAVLLRTIWLESVTRYESIFSTRPPTRIAVFSRRMQAAHGKLVRGGGAMMSHSWFWWDLRKTDIKQRGTQLSWIPPDAQARLERKEDYR